MTKEEDKDTIAEQLSDAATEETEDKKAITRSVHITTQKDTSYIAVTITSQSEDEDIQLIREIAEELMDKYKDSSKSATE